jgi:hypothetical protein
LNVALSEIGQKKWKILPWREDLPGFFANTTKNICSGFACGESAVRKGPPTIQLKQLSVPTNQP